MGDLKTFVLSRVLRRHERGANWLNAAADLEVQLRARIDQQGLVLDRLSDVLVEDGVDEDGTRLTRTATAHPRVV